MADRDFKGVWIPRKVWLDDQLNALEKVILVEIDSFDKGDDDGCWASNSTLAEFCQCTERKVSDGISKLIKLGYIEVISFDGRVRKLRSCIEKNSRQTGKKCEADKKKIPPSNITTNIKSITPYNPPKGKSDYSVGFEGFWKAYPNKKVKSTALKAWNKIRPDDTLLQTILRDVERRKNGEWKDKDKQYIPHPTTYLNQRRWEDEVEIEERYERPWWERTPEELEALAEQDSDRVWAERKGRAQ